MDLFLASDLKFSFHLMWANENWSKRWDGGNAEIILKQDLTEKDFDLFFEDILPYISDPRYEKIDNRPILAIYRPHLFQKDLFKKFLASLDTWIPDLLIHNGIQEAVFQSESLKNESVAT